MNGDQVVTMAGFTAVLTMTSVRMSAGRQDTNLPLESGRIEFQGYLIALKQRGETRKHTKAEMNPVSVTLEFERESPQPYIGVIQLLRTGEESGERRNRANVEVTLPVAMLAPISTLQGRSILFDTIHDERDASNPDDIFADIRRVYFQVAADEPPFPTKRFLWW